MKDRKPLPLCGLCIQIIKKGERLYTCDFCQQECCTACSPNITDEISLCARCDSNRVQAFALKCLKAGGESERDRIHEERSKEMAIYVDVNVYNSPAVKRRDTIVIKEDDLKKFVAAEATRMYGPMLGENIIVEIIGARIETAIF